MNTFDLQLLSLVRCLSSQKIKYVVFGGIAVSIYGEPRLTADIDVNIILDKRQIGEFMDKARIYGFYPAFSKAKKIAEDTGVIPMIFRKREVTGKFDMIIAENQLEYSAIKRGRRKKIGSVNVRIISPEDLVIHKIASSRPRDFEDLKGILIRQKGKIEISYIRYWLKKIDQANDKFRLFRSFQGLLKKLWDE